MAKSGQLLDGVKASRGAGQAEMQRMRWRLGRPTWMHLRGSGSIHSNPTVFCRFMDRSIQFGEDSTHAYFFFEMDLKCLNQLGFVG